MIADRVHKGLELDMPSRSRKELRQISASIITEASPPILPRRSRRFFASILPLIKFALNVVCLHCSKKLVHTDDAPCAARLFIRLQLRIVALSRT